MGRGCQLSIPHHNNYISATRPDSTGTINAAAASLLNSRLPRMPPRHTYLLVLLQSSVTLTTNKLFILPKMGEKLDPLKCLANAYLI